MPRRPKKKNVEIESSAGGEDMPSPYEIKVKVLGKFFASRGDTFEQAISALPIRNARGMSVWTVKCNGREQIKIIPPARTFRILNMHGVARDVALKGFKELFGV